MSVMHIKSIQVENFLQFREKVVIEGFDAGLNIIAGDNEAGKSTLLQAIRSVLFDKYKGTLSEKLAPYNAKVSPRVELIFVVESVKYELNKVFSNKKDGEVTLKASDGKSWEGPEAEDHLSDLLGFSYAPRGQSKSEHQGLAGLLWVEQSKAYEPVTLSDSSRQQVHSVFENEMREMLGGGQGERLHKRIIQLRSEYFDARGNPRGDYKQLQGQAETLQLELADKQKELQIYEDKVDRLVKQQAEFADYQEDKSLEKAVEKVAACKQVMNNIEKLQSLVKAVAEKMKLAEADREIADIAWKSRASLVAVLADTQEKVQRLTEAVNVIETTIEPQVEALTMQQAALVGLKTHREQLEAGIRRASDIGTLRQLISESDRLKAALKEAQQADSKRKNCVLQQDAIQITDALVKQLREIERNRGLAEERLSAIATRIEYQLERDVTARLENNELSGEGALQITRQSKLEVDGVGFFTIVPGGVDIQALQQKLEEHNRALNQILKDSNVDSVAAAEEALHENERLEAQVKQHKATIKALAPEGLSILEESHSSSVAHCKSLQEKLGNISAEEKQVNDLEIEAEELKQQIGNTEEDIDAQENHLRQLRDDLATAKADEKSSSRDKTGFVADLEKERKAVSDDELEKKLTSAEASVDEVERKLKAAQQQLEVETPEVAAAELERAQIAKDDIGENIRTLEREIRDLKVELAALGQKGLAEEVATLDTELENVNLLLEQEGSRARALELLHNTLSAALKDAKEAVAQPITDKLIPYLKQLIPDATPMVDEDLLLTGIQRNKTDESFENLSIGTREQLAVLIRLAYADLLSEKGVPVMVILDDALVNSDDERRDRMKAILFQAAKRYQVLILTCHGREYRDAGGKFFSIN